MKESNTNNNEFLKLETKMRQLREQSQYFRDLLREKGPGHYTSATVYVVAGHKVRAHWRSGWTAVRVINNKPKENK